MGDQVLTSIHQIYESITPVDEFPQIMGILFGYVALAKALHLLTVYLKCSGFAHPATA